MKSLIGGMIGLCLFFCCATYANASRRADSKLPEVFMMADDENVYMTFEGKVLFAAPKKNAGLQYSCKVKGKFPQIVYSGEYTVQGPYHYKDPGVAARIKRENGRNMVSLVYIAKMDADAEKAGINPEFDDAFANRYIKTFDTQSADMPADLKQIEQIVRKDVDKICNDFVKYAIPRLKNPPAY